MTEPSNSDSLLSIGGLSKATNVPINTLRTWERRYGFPVAVRLPSGHRRYPKEQVSLIRWVVRALELGLRPSALSGLDLAQIRLLVVNTGSVFGPAQDWQNEWLDAVKAFDNARLHALMSRALERHSLVEFLDDKVSPFLNAVGQKWAEGVVSVAQEHAASECLVNFLATRWRTMSDPDGTPIVLTTLPGERHALGLHQAAAVLATHGALIHFLGADTPLDNIRDAVVKTGSAALCISISVAADPAHARAMLTQLSAELPRELTIVVGGRGVDAVLDAVVEEPEALKALVHLSNLRALDDWSAGFLVTR